MLTHLPKGCQCPGSFSVDETDSDSEGGNTYPKTLPCLKCTFYHLTLFGLSASGRVVSTVTSYSYLFVLGHIKFMSHGCLFPFSGVQGSCFNQ